MINRVYSHSIRLFADTDTKKERFIGVGIVVDGIRRLIAIKGL